MTEDLSQSARAALINAGTNRQGAAVIADRATMIELTAAGLTGAGMGLTRKGSIARERIVTADLDDIF